MDTQVYLKTINDSNKLLATIQILIARDIPIPIDLHARAVAEGIDVEALINKRK
jgi:hypothetical protein